MTEPLFDQAPTEEPELSEEELAALVGSVDDDAPVVLETADDAEALIPPEHDWDPGAHAEHYRDDPEVFVTEDDEGED